MPRRAKIVCTLGPASVSPERVRDLVRAGMDVARLNLSHGTHEDHRQAVQRVREAAQATGRGVGVLVDLQGPKIRLGTFRTGSAVLLPGERFTITTEPVVGDARRVSTTYQGLPGDLAPGQRVLVDDGRVVLEVVEVAGPQVRTRVVVGGPVGDHKGLNVPGAALTVPALTPKDEEDLRFAIEVRADLVALSFVRGPEDVKAVHAVMDEVGVRLPVLAKLEKPQAVARLDEIVEAFDGLMVARGDLGVELPLEDVPLVQKRAVTRARERSKPTIVATQVLESMVTAPRPTRAEVSDCANAVLDGADAIMLSAETSVGAYPVEATATMARVIETAEHELERLPRLTTPPVGRGGAIARAAADVAATLDARFLVAFTQSGDTARRLARHRCRVPLLAFTPVPAVRNQLSLVWGVETFLLPPAASTDEMIRQVDSALLVLGRGAPGDLVVVVAGTPPGVAGTTNSVRVHRVGED